MITRRSAIGWLVAFVAVPDMEPGIVWPSTSPSVPFRQEPDDQVELRWMIVDLDERADLWQIDLLPCPYCREPHHHLPVTTVGDVAFATCPKTGGGCTLLIPIGKTPRQLKALGYAMRPGWISGAS